MSGSWSIRCPLAVRATQVAAVFIWGLFSVGGLLALVHYSATPGPPSFVATTWPPEVTLRPNSTTKTLVVFVHPHCACSVATLSELERLQAEVRTPTQSLIVFTTPTDTSTAWTSEARLWRRADRIPTARKAIDSGGKLARRFGVETSGHCLLYDEQGKLLFSGGLTIARAHEGESQGRRILRSLLNNEPTRGYPTQVFGCQLIVAGDDSTVRERERETAGS